MAPERLQFHKFPSCLGGGLPKLRRWAGLQLSSWEIYDIISSSAKPSEIAEGYTEEIWQRENSNCVHLAEVPLHYSNQVVLPSL